MDQYLCVALLSGKKEEIFPSGTECCRIKVKFPSKLKYTKYKYLRFVLTCTVLSNFVSLCLFRRFKYTF